MPMTASTRKRGSRRSNLECFLNCTTPIVPSHFLPKTCIRNLNRLWHPWERDIIEYFTLEDLWGCYDEWSAYGLGTPVTLNHHDTVIQYYVPYLSAIQIYSSPSSLLSFRSLRDEKTAGDYESRDSFNHSCSDESESEKIWRWDGGRPIDYCLEKESHWHSSERLGCLYFQYFERSAPYARVPLIDKISGLGQRFPGLMTLKSVDLSPASWMAVAWYPIYHIPMGRTAKDLSSCFLTYHTLSSSFQDIEPEGAAESCEKKVKEEGIALPPFGLATYKMRRSVWNSDDSGKDQERLLSMLSAADSWLKQLRVQHHDFNYFAGLRRV